MITDAPYVWVIHKYWSGETSARVIFLTQEFGLVQCLYKGARAPKKQALLQPFTPLWLAMDTGRDVFFVRHLELAQPSIPFTGKNLFAALYVNELLHHALKPRDLHLGLYPSYVHTLHALAKAENQMTIESALRRFEWNLLTACGYSISLTHEAFSQKPITATDCYQFVPGEGLIRSDDGLLGSHLIALSQDKLDDPAVLAVAKRLMRKAVDFALDGKVMKTRELYQ